MPIIKISLNDLALLRRSQKGCGAKSIASPSQILDKMIAQKMDMVSQSQTVRKRKCQKIKVYVERVN